MFYLTVDQVGFDVKIEKRNFSIEVGEVGFNLSVKTDGTLFVGRQPLTWENADVPWQDVEETWENI